MVQVQSLYQLKVPGCPQHLAPSSVALRSRRLAGREERAASGAQTGVPGPSLWADVRKCSGW